MKIKLELNDKFFNNIFSEYERYASFGFGDKTLTVEQKQQIKDAMLKVDNKELPEIFPEFMTHGSMINHDLREQTRVRLGFNLINQQFINSLAEYIKDKSCLEVMCGTGALSASLQKKGIKVITTDNHSWSESMNWTEDSRWCDIVSIDAVEAVEKYGKDLDFIIMSWPYMDSTAYRVLMKMREVNADCRLIYIGEDHGGCTADDDFFDAAIDINDKEFNKMAQTYQRWDGLHDYVVLYK